jgi:hypothetical protein
VLAASKAVGADPAYLACAILPPIAAAIGNSAVIQLKPDWSEPSVLWVGLVGESGTMKSPIMDRATCSTRKLQAELQYATATGNDGAEQPQLYCSDITVEALPAPERNVRTTASPRGRRTNHNRFLQRGQGALLSSSFLTPNSHAGQK